MMTEDQTVYGEDWDSEEFQKALKVVIKCEIQSLLERLSATGEETVLLTANASELCTDHLASSNAQSFVKTTDIGNIKNKFLNFITGSVVGGSHSQKTVSAGQTTTRVKTPEIPAFLFSNYDPTTKRTDGVTRPVDTKSVNVNNQLKTVEKRPLESGPLPQGQVNDAKRRKTEVTLAPLVNKADSVVSVSSVSSSVSQRSTSPSLSQSQKLKTTRVVSKSGGFTEERLSDAEFQKILAQYKGSQASLANSGGNSSAGSQPQVSQQKQIQQSAGTSKLNKTNSLTGSNLSSPSLSQAGSNSQNVVYQSNATLKGSGKKVETVSVKCELKKTSLSETVADKKSELDKENLPSQASAPGTERGTDKGPTGKDGLATGAANTKRKEESNKTVPSKDNRIDNIDSLDTETLIRMTKQKHFENMSEADREIQAKLGQLSSKLSWVVEYPEQKSQQQGQGSGGQQKVPMPPARMFHPNYLGTEDDDEIEEDYDDDDDDDDDDEFNEDDLDEEDKAALKAMREAHMRKIESEAAGEEDFTESAMYQQGYNLAQGYNQGMMGEDYDETYDDDDDGEYNEDYDEYDDDGNNVSEMRNIMVAGNKMVQGAANMPGQGNSGGVGVIPQQYATASSPSAENFQMIGPIMAKCLICNKIIRKLEMKSHNDNHLNELPYDDEDEEEEEGDGVDDDGVDEEEEDIEELEGDGEEHGEYRVELQEQMGEDEQYGEGEEFADNYDEMEEEPELEPEFTAEKFVAEKLELTTETDTDTSLMCEICNKQFKTKPNLDRHMKKQHSSEKDSSDIKCPCCTKTFKTETNFQKHLKKVHPDYKESPPPSVTTVSKSAKVSTEETDPGSFKCNICNTDFLSQDKLSEHMETHT